jgi:flagellar biogenesis protein FliO
VVLALLAGALALVRRRRAGTGPERPLRVEDRESLGRDSGVALVRAGTDRLLVGWGRDGVRLVARLGVDGGRP